MGKVINLDEARFTAYESTVNAAQELFYEDDPISVPIGIAIDALASIDWMMENTTLDNNDYMMLGITSNELSKALDSAVNKAKVDACR